MPKANPEPLKGAVRNTTPPAQLLGEDEVNALIAKRDEDIEDDDEEDNQ